MLVPFALPSCLRCASWPPPLGTRGSTEVLPSPRILQGSRVMAGQSPSGVFKAVLGTLWGHPTWLLLSPVVISVSLNVACGDTLEADRLGSATHFLGDRGQVISLSGPRGSMSEGEVLPGVRGVGGFGPHDQCEVRSRGKHSSSSLADVSWIFFIFHHLILGLFYGTRKELIGG